MLSLTSRGGSRRNCRKSNVVFNALPTSLVGDIRCFARPPQQRHGSDPSTVSCKPPKAGVASRASKGSRHMLSARLSTSSSTTSTGDRFFETDAATQMGVGDFVIEGDMASDKKASWGNVKEPRGVQVLAWGGLSNVVCEEVLGCSSERLYTVWLSMREGQVRNGQFGSNVVAAMFITCGQDAVSVAEASWSHLTMEYNRETKSLKLSLFFLSLPVGVVGGGTALRGAEGVARAAEMHGPGMKRPLAGLTAAFALALDTLFPLRRGRQDEAEIDVDTNTNTDTDTDTDTDTNTDTDTDADT
ncbi:conserved hypothetical protein [Pyrenophora tritici-repentis Pt-1C-BFP]|uniref:Uncharacterized protein n=1 Tax=Pyrenophora tritici-repentis (strain Pt-1C-BFP) TaxID=426418 RepID=B2WJU0_PYRTR|nr:uncharacterized protein PTRG_10129 [Pyrenophora tritici-repentis Pt-1C-BFP]EDU43180.1 conserved hypothetical protein [Pyrenophora tritici-repentis Pt-1C-BFP]